MKLYNYFRNSSEGDKSQEFRLKKIKEINNFFIKEIDQNEMMSNNNKKICTILNYIECFLTLVFAVIGCVSISTFACLVNISTEIMCSTTGLNIFAIIARIKKYMSIIKKTKNRHDEIALLAKSKLGCTKSFISRSLTGSYFL